jgi:hypothetical protein
MSPLVKPIAALGSRMFAKELSDQMLASQAMPLALFMAVAWTICLGDHRRRHGISQRVGKRPVQHQGMGQESQRAVFQPFILLMQGPHWS